jgi:anti-sigma regulatory factor (Ser/Thr protein kinase)
VRSFHGEFDSSVHSAVQAREAVARFARSCGFCDADLFDITLAVGEACTNAVEHGHIRNGFFSVSCAFENEALRVCVQDDGKQGQRERIVPHKDRVGGLGIFIIREIMDDVKLDIDARGASLSFVKQKSSSGTARSQAS